MQARRPLLASLAFVSAGAPAKGDAAGTAWDLVAEYTMIAMPGGGVAHFAAAAAATPPARFMQQGAPEWPSVVTRAGPLILVANTGPGSERHDNKRPRRLQPDG